MYSSTPESSAGTQSSRSDYNGEFSRQHSSSVLWAHLLRKDILASPTSTPQDVPLPPIAPIDRSGTSTRLILNDTQAHLQRFGQRVDDLVSKMDQTQHDIVTVKTLFQQDREALMNDIVDLVNRVQGQVLKPLGEPAQASKVNDMQKHLELQLDKMDQRLNAIQTFHQTHSQTLQIQAQALQSLQDQQRTIIETLTPLLPLLQAITLKHIEPARNSQSLSESLHLVQNPSASAHAQSSQMRKRPSSSSSHVYASDPKRRRVDGNSLGDDGQDSRQPQRRQGVSPLDSGSSAISTTRTKDTPASVAKVPLSALAGRKPSFLQPEVRTPRRPLAELPLINYALRTSVSKGSRQRVPAEDALDPVAPPGTPLIFPSTPLINSCDPMSRFRKGTGQRPASVQRPERSPTATVTDLHHSSSPIIGSSPNVVKPNLKLPSSRVINTLSKKKPPANPPPTTSRKRGPLKATVHPPAPLPGIHNRVDAFASSGANSTRASTTHTPAQQMPTGAPPSLRQRRRSPFREGRRFIPLNDSEDSDSEFPLS